MRGDAVGDHLHVTILDLIQKTTSYFEKCGVPNARLDVELLLGHVLKLRRMELYLQFERVLTEKELDELRPMVKRRSSREPLQHILGSVDFCGLELMVSPQALIPRPETEILVQNCITILEKENGTVLDVGTGSGAIALAVAHACPRIRCVAVDVSEDALTLARSNAEKSGLKERVDFRAGDLFGPVGKDEMFDLIVSNPPYISTGEISNLQPEVQRDPRAALDGGVDGLDVIRKLISGSASHLKPGGWLLMEIGHDQLSRVKQLLEENGWGGIRFVNDLQGVARVVLAGRP